MPRVMALIQKVREVRLESTKPATRMKAETPWRFEEVKYKGTGAYLAIPKVSSGRRRYIPIGFIEDGMIPGDSLYFIADASPYEFAILTSRVHSAWMRTVAGRWKSDYRYANTIVYSNFIWPDVDTSQRSEIEQTGARVIAARAQYQENGATLEDLYDPDNDWLYPKLTAAHKALDDVVERAYGLEPGCEERVIVERLFKLYGEVDSA